MQSSQGTLLFSAGDLSNYLGCRHLSRLDLQVAQGARPKPQGRDPGLVLLQERGLAHEKAYVEHLRHQGLHMVDLRAIEDGHDAVEKTRLAMQQGVDGIVQAALRQDPWGGRADILLRVEVPSVLGSWSYEVVDTKLAQQTRAGTWLQLALYNDLLQPWLGHHPEHLHVVKPGGEFPTETFRWADVAAYFRRLKADFERAVQADTVTEPLPVPQCDICRWWRHCTETRRELDHLCLVAGLQRLHMEELRRQDIDSLTDLAQAPSLERPRLGQAQTYARLQRQAQVQLEGRVQGAPVYRFRPDAAPPSPLDLGAGTDDDPVRGLWKLPEPSPGDLFFDFEADPFVGEHGLEYLFGYAVRRQDGSFDYRALWALDAAEEKGAFETFIDDVLGRLEADPGLHIYHFSPYEPGAIKRLMGRHGSREDEVDRLLRGERFVDLLAVTRQAMWASVERYSLKELEPFYDFERRLDLRHASRALQHLARALELGHPDALDPEALQHVEQYNREDCLSTAALRDWLEGRRDELQQQLGVQVPRPPVPDDAPSDDLQERQAEVQAVFDGLMAGLPDDEADRNEAASARFLLAHLLEYFRREDKSSWWEFFRLRDLDEDDLLDERKAVSGLELVGEVESTSKTLPTHRYTFPDQECALKAGDGVCAPGGKDIGTVQAMDGAARTVDIRKRRDSKERHPRALFSKDIVRPFPLDQAVLDLGRDVVERLAANPSLDGPGPLHAGRSLLLRRPIGGGSEPLRQPGETVLGAAKRLARQLDGDVLPIQGPPGAGKTYVGARLIVDLVRQGKAVGVTGSSHKVIRHLLEAALTAAREVGVELEAAHKSSSKERAEDLPEGLQILKSNDQARAAVGAKVVGGTAWLWAREDMEASVDVLLVDEAGQLSLAHVLAAARGALNLVLLGDPQQLEQPQKGSHPPGADVAALEHLLGGQATLTAQRGLFLDTTWRLSKPLCDFTSELYYEGRLYPEGALASQALDAPPLDGNGLYMLPVPHEGSQATSPQEVDAVAKLVEQLLRPGNTWTDREGHRRPLAAQDILIVAPYNAHVGALASRLPELRIGTVNRFQGQEAPVVVYSLASSTMEEAPRGMAFLLDPHRMNVATSRARGAAVLVASPRLFEAECRTAQHIRWINGLCRFRELATEIELAGEA